MNLGNHNTNQTNRGRRSGQQHREHRHESGSHRGHGNPNHGRHDPPNGTSSHQNEDRRRNQANHRSQPRLSNDHGHGSRERSPYVNRDNRSRGDRRGNFGDRNGPRNHPQADGQNQRSGAYSEEVSKFGIKYEKIEALCKDMDSKKILPGSSELLKNLQLTSFFNRLDDLWPDPKKQANFLRVIAATASINQADLMYTTHQFVTKVLESKLIPTIVDKTICEMPYDPSLQKPFHVQLAAHLIKLLLSGFATLPSKMDPLLPKVNNVISSLRDLNDRILTEEARNDLDNLEIAYKERQEARAAQRQEQANPQVQGPRRFQGSAGQPPENFRELTVVPTAYDINSDYRPYLRKAIKEGRYDDDEHYLDVQFRLLREDLIRPLREGIADYQRGGAKKTDLYVYKDVEIKESAMDQKSGELLFFITIKVSKRMRWNKRLKYGSLVCLSSDDFRTVFLFATVLERDKIQEGSIGLKFEEMSTVNTKWKYNMVESPAFFEAYRHVMTAMQAYRPGDHIPFSKYLVAVNTETKVPRYLRPSYINFRVLIKPELKRQIAHPKCMASQMRDYLTPEMFGMDDSQFDALVYTLNTDLAVLQGPPGTGKTFMGLQIAKLLFANEGLWNPAGQSRPMLVVCYTNHALDQFLEGIMEFLKEGIIRVGGRCKEALEQFNLSKLRNWKDNNLRSQFYDLRVQTNEVRDKIEQKTSALKGLEKGLASFGSLSQVITDRKNLYHKSAVQLGNRIHSKTHETQLYLWLTKAFSGNSEEYELDLGIIRTLMNTAQISETKAKNALFRSYCIDGQASAKSLLKKLRDDPNYADLPDRELLPEMPFWPMRRCVEEVQRMGYDEKVAIEMLIKTRSKVNIIQDEYNLFRAAVDNRRKAAEITLPDASVETPQDDGVMDALEFQDDDEDNRRIDDTNVLEDLRGAKNQKTKQEDKPKVWYNLKRLEPFLKHIVSAPAMSEEEVAQVRSIWTLSLQARWRLYQYWIRKTRKTIKAELKELEAIYSVKLKQLMELRTMADVDILKHAKVVGMTTTGAAKHQSTLRALGSRIVIIEEAAEVLEGHLLASLTVACEHLILIGDHQQLRPNPAVYELAKHYNLEISLFERLIINNYPHCMLKNQHRMCTDISRVLMPHFYKDLRDDKSVLSREPVKGVTKNLMFITHENPEVSEKEFKSHKNPYEIEYSLCLANYFLKQNYKNHQVTILCTYLEQQIELRRKATIMFDDFKYIRIDSVDNYQGEESDIIILSLVRSENREKKIGYLNIPNRVCVALSRARMGLYVICNMNFLAENCALWEDIRQSAIKVNAIDDKLIVRCQQHGNLQEIHTYKDFEKKCPEGGCNEICKTRKDCGHSCLKPCHVYDMEHTIQKCSQPCKEECASEYRHVCKKSCHQCYNPEADTRKCKTNCHIKVLKTLPCSHQKLDKCHLKPENVKCIDVCSKKLPCGHPCTTQCGTPCTSYCSVKVKKQLVSCGHIVECDCSATTFACDVMVGKEWPICGHKGKAKCSENVANKPCPHPCNTPLPDCEHLCTGFCGQCRNGRLHVRCNNACKRILICGHECKEKCSKICPPCTQPCETICGHNRCGNFQEVGQQLKPLRKQENNQNKGKKGGRLCGEACVPCREPCLNKCEHRQCEETCGKICSVKPCVEPCRKLLPCHPKPKKRNRRKKKNAKDDEKMEVDTPEEPEASEPEGPLHMCLGVCGEDCPKLCKICQPKEYEEELDSYVGNFEDGVEPRFIQLRDCGHLVEVTALDQWIEISSNKNETQDSEIVQIKCPKCSVPIHRSKRYISLLNQRAMDIEKIKSIINGFTKTQQKKESEVFKAQIDEAFGLGATISLNTHPTVIKLKSDLKSPTSVTKSWLTTASNILKIIKSMSKDITTAGQTIHPYKIDANKCDHMPFFKNVIATFKIHHFWEYIKEEFIDIIKKIEPSGISETMVQQLAYEAARFGFIVEMLSYLTKIGSNGQDFSAQNACTLQEILKAIHGSQEFKDDLEKQAWSQLKALSTVHPVSGFGITEQERIAIVQAMGSHVTRWYKCPNGHMYGIGDCGGAVVESRCPECKATIGGASHRIRTDNRDAQTEMLRGTGRVAQPWVNEFEVRY